jgi:modification methylase
MTQHVDNFLPGADCMSVMGKLGTAARPKRGAEPMPDLPLGQILQDDCVAAMRRLPDACVDMVFADPPYNLQLGGELFRPEGGRVDACDDDWDKFDTFEAYDNFTKAWLAEARRILKPNGTLWVIGSYHNIYRVGAKMQDLGYWILNDIIWRKSNPMPNFRGTRFTNAHETLIWASRSEDSRYTFNYRAMKALNDELQMRSDWVLPITAGAERLRDDDARPHPAQKPEALLYRVLLACTSKGDVVLDPFFGTGTTGAVARRLGRQWIGIERDARYIKMAQDRIASTLELDESAMKVTASRASQPKLPFGALVENGIVSAGSLLTDSKRRWTARVLADASIEHDGQQGSIHKIGAVVQGAPACNGWTFWHVERNGSLIALDTFRQEYLAAGTAESSPPNIEEDSALTQIDPPRVWDISQIDEVVSNLRPSRSRAGKKSP